MALKWYESFFEGVTLDLWQKACGPEMTLAEVDFLEKVLRPPAQGRLLDVPCGPGRHLLALAARGYRMTGLDISQQAIEMARAQAASSGLSVELELKDMRDIGRDSQFDGAFCMGNSYGYQDRSETASFLRSLSRALKPGSKFVIDTGMAAESILPHLDERNWFEVDDYLMLIENDYRAAESRLDTLYTFVKDGNRETRQARHFVYSVGETTALLQNAGLQVEALLSSLDEEIYEVGSPRLLLVARKE